MPTLDKSNPQLPALPEAKQVDNGVGQIVAVSPAKGTPGAASPPSVLSANPDVVDLLRCLSRRWLLALSLAVLAGPGGAILLWFVWPLVRPPGHSVQTTVHVSSARSGLIGGAGEYIDFATYQKTQMAMVKSHLVLSAALKDSKVAELPLVKQQKDPLAWLDKNLKVDSKTAPEILNISLTGDRAEDMVVLVDAIREAYLREIVNRQHNELQTKLKRLTGFYDSHQKIIKDNQAKMLHLARSIGAQDPLILEQTHQHLLGRMHEREHDLSQLRTELRNARTEDAAQRAKEKQAAELPLTQGEIEQEMKNDPELEQRRLAVTRLQERIETARLGSKSDGDTIKRLTQALEAAKKSLADYRENLRPMVIAQLRDKARHAARLEAAHRQEKIKVLEKNVNAANQEIAGLETDVARIKSGAVEIEVLRNEIKQNEDAAKKIGDQVQALTVELQAPARMTLLEPATVTTKPDFRQYVGLGGGLGACLLTALSVAWLESRVRRVHAIQQVAEGLGIKLVGTIPDLPQRRPGRLASLKDGRNSQYWRSLLAESIDVIRSVLVRAAEKESLRVVMVTSALEGEGKTTIASHLSISLARAGFRTLLIDGDLRRPTLHRMFGVPLDPGFNEVLRGEATAAETIRDTGLNGLALLSGGYWQESECIRALAQDGIKNLFDELRPAYDFIIVDSSPVLPVVDPLVIGQHVDGVLFSILREVSRLPSIHAAHERMTGLGIRILGAVINGAREGVYESTYQFIACQERSRRFD